MASHVRWENEQTMINMEEMKKLGRAKRLLRMRSVSWGETGTFSNEIDMNFHMAIKEDTDDLHCSPDCELDETCHSGNALLNIDEEQQKNLEQINSVAKLQNVPTVLDLPPCYIATDKYPVELWKHQGYQSTVNLLSALYGIILVVMGMAFPTAQVISSKIPSSYYEGFYVYLYSAAIIFLAYVYFISSTFNVANSCTRCKSESKDSSSPPSSLYGSSIIGPGSTKFTKELDPIKSSNHGSFYLRTGAVVFGVGSMIYSGLEFGQFFDMPDDPICGNVMAAVTPAARMIFTFIQMYFVFLNAKMQKVKSNVTLARFGLMHMVATNLCVWLNVIIQETKHEILFFDHDFSTKYHTRDNSLTQHPALDDHQDLNNEEGDNSTEKLLHRVTRGSLIDECRRMDLMGALTQNASPFLFPCAIEYSLICAAIMYTIWRHAGNNTSSSESPDTPNGIITSSRRSPHHYSVDCTNANKGLFFGIFVLVMTIISMILFFVLINREDYKSIAITEVFIAELVLYSLTLIAVIIGMVEVNQLRFDVTRSLDLDNVLLIVALTGAITYNVFTVIGTQFGTSLNTLLVLVNALTAIVQGVAQTIFILDASKRQLYTKRQQQHKPGREIITFLLVTNFAMWAVITLEKSRFDAHPVQSNFFGKWPWAIITNVSTPLAIFYRYHSTVCLCEIWKRCYKINLLQQNSRVPPVMRSISSPN